MMVPEYGTDKPQARRYEGRQLTRVSKNPKFSKQKRFAKRRKRIRFSKIQLPLGSFLDAVQEYAVEIFFPENFFFVIHFRISKSGHLGIFFQDGRP